MIFRVLLEEADVQVLTPSVPTAVVCAWQEKLGHSC